MEKGTSSSLLIVKVMKINVSVYDEFPHEVYVDCLQLVSEQGLGSHDFPIMFLYEVSVHID